MTPGQGVRLKVHKSVWKRQRESLFDPCGGISGKLRLGMGQEKERDIHWEIHLMHNMELREDPLVICQVDNLRVNYWESLLVQNLELR